jgi:hypothetical protein
MAPNTPPDASELEKQHLTVGIISVLLFLALTSFGLRIYSRLITAGKLWYDDYWMCWVAVISTGMSASLYTGE